MKLSYKRWPMHDAVYLLLFIAGIVISVLLITTFIFRGYVVDGSSMEPTLHPNDHLFVDKVPVTWEHLFSKQWQPTRGQIIVFKNPLWDAGQPDEYLVKRVIGLPGERVVVHDGQLTIYNHSHPDGFQPDQQLNGPKNPSSGEVDRIVEEDALFVCGDNRTTNHSIDSRNGLSTIPLANIQGVVSVRIFPFDQLRWF